MILDLVQFFFGTVLLYYGADILILGSKQIANKFNISPIIIGMTLVALGTSLPELIVSIIANIQGAPGIVVGNVMGSNIANIGLVVGLTAIVKPIIVPPHKIKIDMYVLIFITIIPIALILFGGLNFYHGLVLFCLIFIYCFYLLKNNQLENNKIFVNDYVNNDYYLILKIIIGIIGLGLGATLFVNGARGIAIALGVSNLIIGMSIVALGTSLPELAASLIAAKHSETEFIIGNIIGSNIINILVVLGLSVMIKPILISLDEILIQSILMLLLTIMLYYILILFHKVSRFIGIVFLIIYIFFTYINFYSI